MPAPAYAASSQSRSSLSCPRSVSKSKFDATCRARGYRGPTYFDPFVIGLPISDHKRVLVDGGLYANNPSMLALTLVARHYADSDVLVVSLGTGARPPRRGQDWGRARWAKPLLHIVANGTNKVIDLELQLFLGSERYFRFQADLSEECDLDDASPARFQDLRRLGEDLVMKMRSHLDKVCSQLTRP